MKKEKEEQALRLLRMRELVEDLDSQIGYQESALSRMRTKIDVVWTKLRQLIAEQTPAPRKKETSKKKYEKMRRSLKKYKRKKTQKNAVN